MKGACVFEFWVRADIGVCQLIVDGERPVCFVKDCDVDKLISYIQLQKIQVASKKVSLTTFDRKPCYCLYSKSLKDFFALRKLAKSIDVDRKSVV